MHLRILRKGRNAPDYHGGHFVSDCSDIVLSGQPTPFKNPGSTTVVMTILLFLMKEKEKRRHRKKITGTASSKSITKVHHRLLHWPVKTKTTGYCH